MAYNNRHLLQRIVEIQEIVHEYKSKGHTQVWIYENIIIGQRRLHMSKSTFDNYMCRNARKELREIREKCKQIHKNQPE
jgi:hypothetical protein